MVRRLLKALAVGGVMTALLFVSVDARGGFQRRDSRDGYSFKPNRNKLTSVTVPGEFSEEFNNSVRGRAIPLGSSAINSGISSPGMAVDKTYMDDQIRPDHKGRTVGWRATPDIHFAYTDAPTPTANARYGYNVYSPTLGSWPQGSEVGCEIQPSDGIGQWITADVDGNGFVILAGNDDAGGAEDNHTFYQKSQYSCFWGAGTVILPSQYSVGDFFDPTQKLKRPVVEYQTWNGDTITHLLAGEGAGFTPTGGVPSGVCMYFRKVGNFEAGVWEGPLVIDTMAFANVGSMSASRVSPKVAVAYPKTGVLGLANATINGGFDNEVFYRVSDSVGAPGTWSAPINMTNGGLRTAPSHTPFLETHTLYDSQGGLHIVYNGFPLPANVYDSASFFWIDFSGSIFHWSDRTGLISRVHNAEWGLAQNSQVCGFGSPGVGYLGFENISECNGKMYCTFVQYLDFFGNSGTSQIDDCVSGGFDSRVHAANGEVYMSVSTGLDGLLWDAARNLTNSYTPGCDSSVASGGAGVCMNDTRITVSRYGMDEASMAATFGTLTWPGPERVDPTGTYTGDFYLHAFYLEDHWPAPAWRDSTWGHLTENPLNWMRLACVDPVTAPQLAFAPQSTGFPDQTDHGMQKVITVTVTNDGNTGLNVTQIGTAETSGPTGWLAISATTLTVPAGASNTATFDITINQGGLVNSPGTIVALSGEVYMLSDAPAPRDSVSFPITNFIVGPVAPLTWDSVSTGAIQLTVSNHGEMGNGGLGGANMDYTAAGLDCDSAQDVYLFEGSPVIIQKIDSAAGIFKLSTNLFTGGFAPDYAFKPITGQTAPGSFVGPGGSDAMNTGTFVNWDSTIAVEQTYYAPAGGTPNDDFIIVKTVFSSNDGLDHANLLLGDVLDWDVPSDNGAANVSGINGKTVYLQGADTATTPGCQLFANRFAGSTFLGMYSADELNADPCANDNVLQGVYASDNTGDNLEAQGSPNNALDSALAWNSGQLTGQWNLTPDTLDQRINQTYVWDYTLGATNSLTVYTALTTVLNGTVTDLDDNVKAACDWYGANLRPGCSVCSCCKGVTGNVDNDPNDISDITDLTVLIDHLFINFPVLDCPAEANVDGDLAGLVDITDLTFLIDHLFINFPENSPCQ